MADQQTPPDVAANNQLRLVLADTYSFVRSAEINKTIASYTFDHYIDEAKQAIQQDRILQTASGADGIGTRPSQMSALTKLETDFNNAMTKLQAAAQAADAPSNQTT